MNEIVLYNHFHNGDIFYSRVITQALSKYFIINYHHKLARGLFEDIKEINEYSSNIDRVFNMHTSSPESGFVNTWIGQYNMKYVNMHNCSFRSNILLLNDILSKLNLKIENEVDLLPVVRYDNLSNIKLVSDKINDIEKKYEKIIFISSGDVHSSQSLNFNFSPIINQISDVYPEYCFITTTNLGLNKENIIFSSNITEKQSDLLLLSYISTKSDVIIGRSSGPFCFSHVKENLLNTNKTFISFSRSIDEGTWYDKSTAKQIWSNNYDTNNIINTIKNNI